MHLNSYARRTDNDDACTEHEVDPQRKNRLRIYRFSVIFLKRKQFSCIWTPSCSQSAVFAAVSCTPIRKNRVAVMRGQNPAQHD
eukprot:6393-Heterococcus_DN1.PRE.3